MCRCGVGLNQLKDVQDRESTSLFHGQIRTFLYVSPLIPRHLSFSVLSSCFLLYSNVS
jgi:hypothetical protein